MNGRCGFLRSPYLEALLALCVVALPFQQMTGQTFEQPVTVLENSQLMDWFSDVEVNALDATTDMLYTTWDGSYYHVNYLKVFSDGTVWKNVDLGVFATETGWPPFGSVTQHNGHVFVVAVAENREASFFASDDAGSTFSSFPPGPQMHRADILANDEGCHLMFVDDNFNLVYGLFDPLQGSWTIGEPLRGDHHLIPVRPSLANNGNMLSVVYQNDDTLHYERTRLSGSEWSDETVIPKSELIEIALNYYPQLGPKVVAVGQRFYAGWAGSPPGGLSGPFVGTSRKSLLDPPLWGDSPYLFPTNSTYFGLAGNSVGSHYAYWNAYVWDGSLLEYRRWQDDKKEPDDEINLQRVYDDWPPPRLVECGAHNLGVSVFYGDFPGVPKIKMIRETFAQPAPPAGLTVVPEPAGDRSDSHPVLNWYRNNFSYQVAEYVIWRAVVPSIDPKWHPIDSVDAETTTYLDKTLVFDPLAMEFAQYKVVTKTSGGVYSDFSNMASIRVSEARMQSPTEVSQTPPLPTKWALLQNHPNPFNPTTMIRYDVPNTGQVSIKVYDVLGKEVASVVDAFVDAGSHEVRFDATHLSSGIYYCRMEAGSFAQMKKMVLLK